MGYIIYRSTLYRSTFYRSTLYRSTLYRSTSYRSTLYISTSHLLNFLARITCKQCSPLSEVLDEVKVLDKDRWKELYCDFREVSHAPQPLRHEDSSTVWADLQHYKGLCSKIKRELHRVEEAYDKIKLQRSVDINTFNGL